MRQKRVSSRGRFVWIVAAAGIGYLIGTWNATAVRTEHESTAAQTIALRFPEDTNRATAAPPAGLNRIATAGTLDTADAQLALFEPQLMIPRPASLETAAAPAQAAEPQPPPPPPVAEQEPTQAPAQHLRPAPHVATVKRAVSGSGHLLDDAQIARIKLRLHMTPDQEQMWPAVEAALRNFARAREARQRGVRAGAINPNSAEVQELKSAAIPLLMSFSSEQRDEVRNLAHTMGLDQLASQF